MCLCPILRPSTSTIQITRGSNVPTENVAAGEDVELSQRNGNDGTEV